MTATGVMLVLGISHSPKLLLAWPILLGVGITFSCIALIFNALANGYDFFTYYFTLFLTPMTFLSGVLPLGALLVLVRVVADWLPLSNAGGAGAPAVPDQWPQDALRPALVLLTYAAASFWLAPALTRKRFRASPPVPRLWNSLLNCVRFNFEQYFIHATYRHPHTEGAQSGPTARQPAVLCLVFGFVGQTRFYKTAAGRTRTHLPAVPRFAGAESDDISVSGSG
ncbi:MAG: hypothetical protein U5M23_01760, partial [Marinagarivorans sp.]|nr:hypothetical protein [Marinagarivorans sp.]